jgi:hypothetical protein
VSSQYARDINTGLEAIGLPLTSTSTLLQRTFRVPSGYTKHVVQMVPTSGTITYCILLQGPNAATPTPFCDPSSYTATVAAPVSVPISSPIWGVIFTVTGAGSVTVLSSLES